MKILAIAWKELYTTFRNRNLILLMFATPLVVSTIIGLAFGGDGDSDTPDFANIPVAVVNLDEGFNLQDEINLPAGITNPDALPFDPNDIVFTIGDTEINLGEQLNLNFDGVSLNFGDQLASILLSQPIAINNTVASAGIDSTEITCSLLDTAAENSAGNFSSESALDELLDATAVADPDVARAGVEEGEYAVAVIIPQEFSRQLTPRFYFEDDGRLRSDLYSEAGAVEVYANSGRAISGAIVRSIVEGIVNQFGRVRVALSATLETSVNSLIDSLEGGEIDVSGLVADVPAVIANLQPLTADALEPLGCLITPGASNITVDQQPLDALQEASRFARITVAIGSSQAVFFALFTGIFGMYSIYEERQQWTLQRLIVSPTPRVYLLAGKLLGNLVVVFVQLLILLSALTLIASIVIGEPTFVWGSNLALIFLVILALALCVSGLGVFVVGLAKTQEQVVLFGPMINITLAVLGGAFSFSLPERVSQFSFIYWGVDAFTRLASSQLDGATSQQAGIVALFNTDVALNLLVLLGQGIALFLVGAWLFKRRMEL